MHEGLRFDLERFVSAQAPIIERAMEELRAGRKRSHWMWFVFPQIAGLGRSVMADYYAIANLDEARAYLAHPLLGERLKTCTELVLAVEGKNARDIFGSPDDLKFSSSMTLFAAAAPEEKIFQSALEKYFGGEGDALTMEKPR
jgi:uncharacterized protein (DUF1810 family)